MDGIRKLFREERTDTLHSTLEAAKEASLNPHVYRVWMRGGRVIGRELIYAYGIDFCSAEQADGLIEKLLSWR